MPASHQIRKGSGRIQKVREFYAANPGEELTFSDLCAKFDCNLPSARDIVRKLTRDRVLETAHVIRAKVGR